MTPSPDAALIEALRAASYVLREADQKQYQNSIPTSPGPSLLLRHATLMSDAADALSRRVEGEGWRPIETAPRVLWQPVWLYWIQGNQPVLGFWEEPDVHRGETVGCWNVVERDGWYTDDKFSGWQEVVRPALTPPASSSGEG